MNRAKPESLGVGVIGVGGMGARHAENVQQQVVGAHLAAVMDRDAARAESVARQNGIDCFCVDAEALILDDAVAAVIIASPNQTHAELVLRCLQQGKPVLCEKPLALTAAEAWDIIEMEVALGRRLVQVGFMRRYDPHHLAVKRAAEDGLIGRPRLFKGVHRNMAARPDIRTRNVTVGSAVHDLDSARWLLGQEIDRVFMQGVSTAAEPGDAACDLQLIHLQMQDGSLGIIEVHVNAAYGYEVSAELVGTAGTAQTLPFDGVLIRREQRYFQPVEAEWLARFQQAYANEVQSWVRDLHQGRQTGPNAWDGYVSLLAAERCLDSLKSGRPEVLTGYAQPALYALHAEGN